MRKLRNDGHSIRIDDRIDALRAVLAETPDLIAAYIFGSYGTPDQTPLSDVDMAFVFRLDREPDFDQELDFRGAVLDALQQEDTGIVILNEMPSPFQHEVLSTGRRIFCADEIALADFVERVLRVHGDFIVDYRRFLAEYDAALRARYAHV